MLEEIINFANYIQKLKNKWINYQFIYNLKFKKINVNWWEFKIYSIKSKY